MHSTIVFLVVSAICYTKASHFRGGTISWEHLGSNGSAHEIEFLFHLGWRRDHLSPRCNASSVLNQIQGYDGGSWQLDRRASSTEFSRSTAIICTSYDVAENWAYGFNNFKAKIFTSGPFTVSFTGGDWINSLAFGGSGGWSLALVDIDLAIRSDTGLLVGCPASIKINAIDKDNDDVSCRYGIGSVECGGVCGNYSHFFLNRTSCTIDYDGGGGAVTVSVALMLEDHPKQALTLGAHRNATISDSLSSIPLQILVSIIHADACNVLPTYPDITVQDGAVITIPAGGSLNETLLAYPSNATLTITQFVAVGPVGVVTSDIFSPSNGLFAGIITWQPLPSQEKENLICYYAVDSSGKRGKQICFTVRVAAISNPCEVDNGGCSDVCIPQGVSRICDCSQSCWELANDKKTCVPEMLVTCDGFGMDISIARCAVHQSVFAGPNSNDFGQSTCQSTKIGSREHLTLGHSDCGLNIKTNPVIVQYVVKVWFWHDIDVIPIITRGEWRSIRVTCLLPVGANVTGSFYPILPISNDFVPIEIEGSGEFSFYFEYYRTRSFSATYTPDEYPIEVGVDEDIFFTVGAWGGGDLVFFIESCVAMSSRTIENSTSIYTFIQNGCFFDPTLVRYPAFHTTETRLSIKAFEFKDRLLLERKTSEIFLQCQVMLCDANDNGTRCAQGCLSPSGRRKRRSEGTELTDDDYDDDFPQLPISESVMQSVDSRFILLIQESPANDGNEITNYTNWILIGLGVALLAVAIFVAYWVVKKKRAAPCPPEKDGEERCSPISDITV